MSSKPLSAAKGSTWYLSGTVFCMTGFAAVFLFIGVAVAFFALTFGVEFEPDEEFERFFDLTASLILFGGSVPFGIGVGLLVGAFEVARNNGKFPK